MLHTHHYYHSLIFVIFISPLCILAQTKTQIKVGSTITAAQNSNPWLSPSGDFAFGFQQLPNTTDLFILSIWFNKIPDRTIVWFQNTSYPVPLGSTLRIDAAQGLLLQDSRGRSLWNSNNGINDEVAYGNMNDTGNFILSSRNSAWLWQSFRNPSDTILPTQTIETGGTLISRNTQFNFSHGKFYGAMREDGDFVLYKKSSPSTEYVDSWYYHSQTSLLPSYTSNSDHLSFSEKGIVSIIGTNGTETILTLRSNPPASENYYRLTLSFDGVLTQYYHPRSFSGNPGWNTLISWPDNICVAINGDSGSGACGYNNVCTLVDKKPVCKCPRGYSLIDANNPHGDCLPNLDPTCVAGENSSAFEMMRMDDTNWPFSAHEEIYPITEENCRNVCLSDCLCSAVIYEHSKCWKKQLPLANGKVDTTEDVITFLKLRRGDHDPAPIQLRRSRKTFISIQPVLLGSSMVFNFLLIAAGCLGFCLIKKKKNLVHITAGVNLRCFTYKELLQATDGFKEELGRGAFGVVYKGTIEDCSKSIVAVKKLDRVSEDSEKEFKAEVNIIGQTHQKNLVRLLGFCDEESYRLLVYEYMSNGTLADFLFGTAKRSWSLRSQIALGVARGLTYLHEECITQIIHCDIKPQNILIDEYYTPRISDFGLAKLLMMNQTRTLTNIRGTKGYVAPEWFRNTPITAKVDVYSFGVLLLEIISCRKNLAGVEKFEDEENPILTDWVWDCYQENQFGNLVEHDMEALSDRTRLQRFVMVGLWCVQENASLRPSMRKASQMLEGIVEIVNPPCPSYSITT